MLIPIVGEDYLQPLDLQFFLDESALLQRFCVQVMIVDDTIMFEGDEQFRVFFDGLPNDQVVVGTNSEVCVTIIDNDSEYVTFQ